MPPRLLLFFLGLSLSVQSKDLIHFDTTKWCFNSYLLLKCGEENYFGPVNIKFYDDNFFFFGGDTLLAEVEETVEFWHKLWIRDRTNPYFCNPYFKITTYCRKKFHDPAETAEDKKNFRQALLDGRPFNVTVCRILEKPLKWNGKNPLEVQLNTYDEC